MNTYLTLSASESKAGTLTFEDIRGVLLSSKHSGGRYLEKQLTEIVDLTNILRRQEMTAKVSSELTHLGKYTMLTVTFKNLKLTSTFQLPGMLAPSPGIQHHPPLSC